LVNVNIQTKQCQTQRKNVGWQEKLFKFTVQMMRAPYKIGEEIRGMLLKIFYRYTQKNGAGRYAPHPHY